MIARERDDVESVLATMDGLEEGVESGSRLAGIVDCETTFRCPFCDAIFAENGIKNLSKCIDDNPVYAIASFKEIDLINEPDLEHPLRADLAEG